MFHTCYSIGSTLIEKHKKATITRSKGKVIGYVLADNSVFGRLVLSGILGFHLLPSVFLGFFWELRLGKGIETLILWVGRFPEG